MFCLSGLGSLWQICRHQGLSGIHSKLEGYFFPWHFAAETAPIRKLRSVTLPNMSFLLPLYFISTGKEGRCWPMRPGQWERRNGRRPLLAVEKLIRCHVSHTKRNYSRYHPLKFVLRWRKKSDSFLQVAQLFRGIYLSPRWSHFLKDVSIKKAGCVE